jgi:hypothetical protein
MKVYSVPDAVPYEPTYNGDWQAREEAHREALRRHLTEAGYNGPHSGQIASFSVADGRAQYMLADGAGAYGPSFLIHLPYGDAYQYLGVEHFPKSSIVDRIEQGLRMDALFANRKVSA